MKGGTYGIWTQPRRAIDGKEVDVRVCGLRNGFLDGERADQYGEEINKAGSELKTHLEDLVQPRDPAPVEGRTLVRLDVRERRAVVVAPVVAGEVRADEHLLPARAAPGPAHVRAAALVRGDEELHLVRPALHRAGEEDGELVHAVALARVVLVEAGEERRGPVARGADDEGAVPAGGARGGEEVDVLLHGERPDGLVAEEAEVGVGAEDVRVELGVEIDELCGGEEEVDAAEGDEGGGGDVKVQRECEARDEGGVGVEVEVLGPGAVERGQPGVVGETEDVRVEEA